MRTTLVYDGENCKDRAILRRFRAVLLPDMRVMRRDHGDTAITLLAPHSILAELFPRPGSRIEAAAGSARMRWRRVER